MEKHWLTFFHTLEKNRRNYSSSLWISILYMELAQSSMVWLAESRVLHYFLILNQQYVFTNVTWIHYWHYIKNDKSIKETNFKIIPITSVLKFTENHTHTHPFFFFWCKFLFDWKINKIFLTAPQWLPPSQTVLLDL